MDVCNIKALAANILAEENTTLHFYGSQGKSKKSYHSTPVGTSRKFL